MARVLKIIWIPIVGLALILGGLVYDTVFAGIPYQDPTPALQAQWEFQRSVANLIYKIGGLVFLTGVIAVPFIWKRTRTTRRKTN